MGQNLAIVDVGSSKVICLICSADGKDAALHVHGAGIQEYNGYKKGVFEDEQAFTNAIVDALTAAETEAKHRIRDVSIGVPAPFMRVELFGGRVRPSGRNKRIAAEDIEALMNASLQFALPEGFELIHSTPISFFVDGVEQKDTPIGQPADVLSANVSHVLLDKHFKALVSDALGRVGLDADMYIGVPLSEALFVIPEAERVNGAVLIDVGATHTDVSLVQNNALIACKTIDIGGVHFTNDLSYGLRTQPSIAENVKRRYVYALDYQDSIDIIPVPGSSPLRVEHAAIQFIVEARSRELAALIVKSMMDMGVHLSGELPVYLTGGGVSLMRGSCEFLERETGLTIQVRMPWMPRLSSPNYASAYSVMDFVIRAEDDENAGRLEGLRTRGNSIITKIKDFLIG